MCACGHTSIRLYVLGCVGLMKGFLLWVSLMSFLFTVNLVSLIVVLLRMPKPLGPLWIQYLVVNLYKQTNVKGNVYTNQTNLFILILHNRYKRRTPNSVSKLIPVYKLYNPYKFKWREFYSILQHIRTNLPTEALEFNFRYLRFTKFTNPDLYHKTVSSTLRQVSLTLPQVQSSLPLSPFQFTTSTERRPNHLLSVMCLGESSCWSVLTVRGSC